MLAVEINPNQCGLGLEVYGWQCSFYDGIYTSNSIFYLPLYFCHI